MNSLEQGVTCCYDTVGFLARVFDVFREFKISVDVVATSEVSVSFTLDVNNLWTAGVAGQKLQVRDKLLWENLSLT